MERRKWGTHGGAVGVCDAGEEELLVRDGRSGRSHLVLLSEESKVGVLCCVVSVEGRKLLSEVTKSKSYGREKVSGLASA